MSPIVSYWNVVSGKVLGTVQFPLCKSRFVPSESFLPVLVEPESP